jgi:hypothetical protein
MLAGSFAMQFSGTAGGAVGGVAMQPTAAAGPVTAAPVAGLSRLYLDGAGSLYGYSALNARGQWQQGSVTGTFNVNNDCTASFALTDAGGNTQNFAGVVIRHGDAALVLQTDAATGVSGTLSRVRAFCQTSDLVGAFGLQHATQAGGSSSTGVLVFDGQGGVTALESRYNAGAAAQVASTGTVAINTDCSVGLTLVSQVDGTAVNFLGMVSADDSHLFLVRTDPWGVSSGSAVAQ